MFAGHEHNFQHSRVDFLDHQMTVVPVGALDDPKGTPAEIVRLTPERQPVTGAIKIELA